MIRRLWALILFLYMAIYSQSILNMYDTQRFDSSTINSIRWSIVCKLKNFNGETQSVEAEDTEWVREQIKEFNSTSLPTALSAQCQKDTQIVALLSKSTHILQMHDSIKHVEDSICRDSMRTEYVRDSIEQYNENLQEVKSEHEAKQKQAREAKVKRQKLIERYQESRFLNEILNHKVAIGMTKQMVIDSWGKPEQINRTVGSWGIHEQWIYGRTYLYLENGLLTSFQDSE